MQQLMAFVFEHKIQFVVSVLLPLVTGVILSVGGFVNLIRSGGCGHHDV